MKGILKKYWYLFAIVLVAIIGISLFLIFSNEKIEITFDSNGGDAVDTIKAKKGEEVKLPTTKKDGFVFEGWYNENKKVNSKTSFDKDTKLVANWLKEGAKTFVVTFDSNGGSEIESITLEEGAELTLPVAPTKKGYTFVGWFDENEMPILSGALLECEDITLYAKWNEEKKEEKNTETKKEESKKEVTYTCPSGYTLDDNKCTKKITKKGYLVCPDGTKEVNGVCYTASASARVAATVGCESKNVHVGNGSTPITEGTLITIPNAYSYCVYGLVKDSYEQQNKSNCTARGHFWAYDNKCYYEGYSSSPTSYKTNTCSSGYGYIENPTSTLGLNGVNGGCFPIKDKVGKCGEGFTFSEHPVDGPICTKTETIDATEN